MTSRSSALWVALVVLASAAAFAAGPEKAKKPAPAAAEGAAAPEEEEKLPPGMQVGPAKVKLGSEGELQVAEGVIFGDAAATKALLEKSGNLTNGQELGVLLDGDGATIFEFDPVGYVKDDDKDALDADKMLTSLKEGQEAANVELKRLGRPELEVTRWEVKPHYDLATHNLEWGPIVKDLTSGHESVNYNVRILGRKGVMEVTLIIAPEKLQAQLPAFRSALKGFTFVSGQDYGSWRQGDKVAAYGLAALVTGGVVAAAAKSGLLAKLWKPIGLGLAALVGAIKKLFGKKAPASITNDTSRPQ